MNKKELNILGLRVDAVSFVEAVSLIEGFIKEGGKYLITTPYAESVVAGRRDAEFRRIVNNCALAVPDGGGLLAAADFQSYRLPPRGFVRLLAALIYGVLVGVKLLFFRRTFKILKEPVRGVDLLESLCFLAHKKGLKVYLLGGRPDIARRAAAVLKSGYPNLQIRSDAGPKNLAQASERETASVIERINEFEPDFLFAAFKPVEQEKWFDHNMERINAKVFMAVGGAFDMIAGSKPRAPGTFRSLSLEWLWRLLIEPSRVGRIYNAVIVFPWLVFREKLRTG